MMFEIKVTHEIGDGARRFFKELIAPLLENNHAENLEKLACSIESLEAKLSAIIDMGVEMSNRFEDVRNEVAAYRTVADSAIALIKGLADKVEAAGTDEQELGNLVADLRAGRTSLAAAISENTPGVIAEPLPMTRPVLNPDLIDPDNPSGQQNVSSQTTQSIHSPDGDSSRSLDGPDEPTP